MGSRPPDPLRDGSNWYAYCGQDPVNFIDPLGLCGEEADKLFFGQQNWGLGYDILPKVKAVSVANPVLNFGAGVLGETWNLAATAGNFGFTVAGVAGEPVLGAVGWVDEQAKQYLGADLATISIILKQLNNEYAAFGSSLTKVLSATSQYAKVAFMSRWGGLLNGSTPKVISGVAQTPKWKQYEMKYGGEQTTMNTTFNGQNVTVRLDKPPANSTIIDFKDYNWSNQSYQKTFIQQQVVEDFTTQIQKYQTIAPNVHLQFSQDPPTWVVDAINAALLEWEA